jgi:signal peptidase I
MPKAMRVHLTSVWQEWLRPLLVVAFLLGSFRSAIADWNDVPTGSMKPTIVEGDRIFVDRRAYDLRVPFTSFRVARYGAPARGDIIVFSSPVDGRRLVKRVIGLPGDTVAVRDGHLVVNGTVARYVPLGDAAGGAPVETEALEGRAHPVMSRIGPAGPAFGPTRVPDGHYFVMGDHRDDSFDSRYWGFLERERIQGRAVAVALSFDWERYGSPRWGRFFTRLP